MTLPALNMDQSLIEISGLLGSQSGSIQYRAGSRIFEQGQPGDCAYMIDSGYVEVSYDDKGKRTFLATLGPGEIFGEMSLLDGQPRSATAIALHETTVICIPRKQLLDAVNAGNPITRLILIASIARLRRRQATNFLDGEETGRRIDRDGHIGPRYAAARANAAEQVRLQFELESAVAKREFKLDYQPIVALADGRTAGFEALVRWPRSGKRLASPMEFIPTAEDTGLIVPLGLWILERGLQALSAIDRHLDAQRADRQPVFMSVNVSPRQLDTEVDIERLATIIERADVDPCTVKIEITEQTLLDDPNMAMIGLSRLKATGASIAIDDFGTGYSSLNYLHRFPLDTLKIDRSFVTKIVDDPSGQRVVSAIIGLARELGMDVVAEGIEELEELRWLQSHGCRYGQGYLMAKPAPFTKALSYLHQDFEW